MWCCRFGRRCTRGTTGQHKIASYKRSYVRSSAAIGANEGYQWGRRDPPPTSTRGARAATAPGFTFKTWKITSASDRSFTAYDKIQIHGPYSASSFYGGGQNIWWNIRKSYSTTRNMDAFASTYHVAMIYSEGSSSRQHFTVEGKAESVGARILLETYRVAAATEPCNGRAGRGSKRSRRGRRRQGR